MQLLYIFLKKAPVKLSDGEYQKKQLKQNRFMADDSV